jgi:hypothetical protein
MYFSLNFAHIEWMVHVNDIRHPFLLVDDMGRELDEETARGFAADHDGVVFNWGQPAKDASATSSGSADESDLLTQELIDGINSNPIARRAFTRLAKAYEDGAL